MTLLIVISNTTNSIVSVRQNSAYQCHILTDKLRLVADKRDRGASKSYMDTNSARSGDQTFESYWYRQAATAAAVVLFTKKTTRSINVFLHPKSCASLSP